MFISFDRIPGSGLVVDEVFDFTADSEVRARGHFRGKVTPHGSDAHITGTLEAERTDECNLCLCPFQYHASEDVDVVAAPPARFEKSEEEVELTDEEADMYMGTEAGFDLSDLIRQELILGQPIRPVCSSECKGLCEECGANLNKGACSCAKGVDPRLAILKKLSDSIEGDK